jgi:hypothetical protein
MIVEHQQNLVLTVAKNLRHGVVLRKLKQLLMTMVYIAQSIPESTIALNLQLRKLAKAIVILLIQV